ncbi:hypothetical protein V8E36_008671 [Tilletia maclaganii]
MVSNYTDPTGHATLVEASDHLVQALTTLEAASRDFASHDGAVRKRGEAVFLSLRDSDAALQYACFALQHSQDGFVLFQMLGLILQQLPMLSGPDLPQAPSGPAQHHTGAPAGSSPTLQQLRNFLLQFVVARAEGAELAQLQQGSAPTSAVANQWPPYVRTRAFQLIAAVTKRMLGIQLGQQHGQRYTEIVQHQLGQLRASIMSLITLPPNWPSGHAQSDTIAFVRANTGLGIFRACLDEFVLTPAGTGPISGDDLAGLSGDGRDSGSFGRAASGNRSASSAKLKQKEHASSVGLTGREHMLCKIAVQEELLPELLSSVLHMLVTELQRPAEQSIHLHPHLLFCQLVSTIEKLFSWSFTIKSISQWLSGSSSHADDDNDIDFESFSSPAQSPLRSIPAPISTVLLSPDVLRLLSASYAAAQTSHSTEAVSALASQSAGPGSRAAIDAGREASTALHRLQTCILLSARFQATSNTGVSEVYPSGHSGHLVQSPQDMALQSQHVEGLLELLAGLVQGLGDLPSAMGTGAEAMLASLRRGQSLLFVVHLLGNFAAVMQEKPEWLASGLGLAGLPQASPNPQAFNRFLHIASQTAVLVFDFSFDGAGARTSSDGDEIADLAETCVHQLIDSWMVLSRVLRAVIDEGNPHQTSALWAAVRDDVVRSYYRGRLRAARGSSASSTASVDGDAETEIGSTTEKDRDRFVEQLKMLAELARISPDVVGPILIELSELAEETGAVLIGAVQSGSGRPLDASDSRALEARWEEIHWLFLVAGSILADDGEGELPYIPKALESLHADEPASPSHAVVRLIRYLALTLFEALSSESAVRNELSSPLVMETMLWFVNRCLASYVLPLFNDAGDGEATSNKSLNEAFGASSRHQIIQFFSERSAEMMRLWLAEPDVLKQLATLIYGFSKHWHAAAELVALPTFSGVVSSLLDSLDTLPVQTHGSFISAIVGTTHAASRWAKSEAGRSASAEQRQFIIERTEMYTASITQALEQRLSSAVLRPDFAAVAQSSNIIQAVQTALDMLEGLAVTIQLNPGAGIYSFITRFFPTLIQIVEVYSERSEITILVLKVFRTLSVSTAWAISDDKTAETQLNEAVWALFGAIERKRNIIGVTDFGAADDDNPYEALCLTLETLSGILDLTDTGNVIETPGSDRLFGSLSPLYAEDVGLYGFSVLFPSLTASSLADPRVREKLCRVTCTAWLFFPGRIFAIARAEAKHGQANGLIEVLVRLLSADESRHISEALEAVRTLAKAVKKLAVDERAHDLCSAILPDALHQLIYVLLRSILLEPSEDLDGQIIALRPLLAARASPAFGGDQGLSSALQHFCSSTPLHSLREYRSVDQGLSAGSMEGPPVLSAAEEGRRREILSSTVAGIAQACFASLQRPAGRAAPARPSNVKEALLQQREERKAEAEFCETVKGHGLLRARRALRIR